MAGLGFAYTVVVYLFGGFCILGARLFTSCTQDRAFDPAKW
jgi:hypothetical protein